VFFVVEADTIIKGDRMITRCTLAARIAAFLVMTVALFAATTTAQAQAIDCSQCGRFTFAVSRAMNCSVTICYADSPVGGIVCKTLNPGESTSIDCSVYQVWVNTCSGPYYLLVPSPHGALCSPELKFAVGCCGQICNVPSADLCPRLEVQPRQCASLSCP
jgi:hypothetical protein